MVVDSSSEDDLVSEDSEAQKQRRQAVLDQLRASSAAGRQHSEAIAFQQQRQRLRALHNARAAGEQASTSKQAQVLQGIRDQHFAGGHLGLGLGYVSLPDHPTPQGVQADLQDRFTAAAGPQVSKLCAVYL